MVDFTEMPYAEDFAQDLAALIERYMDSGMSAHTAKSVLMDAMLLDDEDEED